MFSKKLMLSVLIMMILMTPEAKGKCNNSGCCACWARTGTVSRDHCDYPAACECKKDGRTGAMYG